MPKTTTSYHAFQSLLLHEKQKGPGGTAVRYESLWIGQAVPLNMLNTLADLFSSNDPRIQRFCENLLASPNIDVKASNCNCTLPGKMPLLWKQSSKTRKLTSDKAKKVEFEQQVVRQ